MFIKGQKIKLLKDVEIIGERNLFIPKGTILIYDKIITRDHRPWYMFEEHPHHVFSISNPYTPLQEVTVEEIEEGYPPTKKPFNRSRK